MALPRVASTLVTGVSTRNENSGSNKHPCCKDQYACREETNTKMHDFLETCHIVELMQHEPDSAAKTFSYFENVDARVPFPHS